MGEFVQIETEDGTALVTVTREKAMNALNSNVLGELQNAFNELSRDAKVRCVIITGAGDKAFIAGADIAAMKDMTEKDAEIFVEFGHKTMNTIQNCQRPVIAAVNGFALGGGLELALSCDFIYASEKAKFALPEVGLGLYPGFGGTQRLSRAIGPNRARELIFTGRMISAVEAERWGLVNKVCAPEQLLEEARKTATEINQKGPIAISRAKRVINEGKDEPLNDGLEAEKRHFPGCFNTEDLKEGLAAFLEKRKPEFKGQ